MGHLSKENLEVDFSTILKEEFIVEYVVFSYMRIFPKGQKPLDKVLTKYKQLKATNPQEIMPFLLKEFTKRVKVDSLSGYLGKNIENILEITNNNALCLYTYPIVHSILETRCVLKDCDIDILFRLLKHSKIEKHPSQRLERQVNHLLSIWPNFIRNYIIDDHIFQELFIY